MDFFLVYEFIHAIIRTYAKKSLSYIKETL